VCIRSWASLRRDKVAFSPETMLHGKPISPGEEPAVLGLFLAGPMPAARAAAVLDIQPITWHVIGLDSNNVTIGPDIFSVGARVCNIGDTDATNVTVTLVM
jgi:hypothetical protein